MDLSLLSQTHLPRRLIVRSTKYTNYVTRLELSKLILTLCLEQEIWYTLQYSRVYPQNKIVSFGQLLSWKKICNKKFILTFNQITTTNYLSLKWWWYHGCQDETFQWPLKSFYIGFFCYCSQFLSWLTILPFFNFTIAT